MASGKPTEARAISRPLTALGKLRARFSFRQYLIFIFLLSLAARAALIFLLSNFNRVSGMENEGIALNMLAGKGYSYAFIVNEMPTAIVGPVYTVFLYLHFLFFGKNYLPVELSQALIASVSALVLALIGRRMAGERVGIISGFLFALYPTYAYWCALPLQLTVDIFMLELSILLVMLAFDRQKLAYHILAGAWIGLTALSKSFYLSFLILYLAWVWLWQRPNLKSIVYAGCVWAACAALVITPWSIRNYRVFREWVPLTTNGGANLWYGNNPNATGALYTKDGRSMLSTIPRELMNKIAGAKTEAEKDRILSRAGKDWAKSHPQEFLKLVPLRLRAIWWFDPEMESSFPALRKMVYAALLVFAIPGIILALRLWKQVSIFYLLAAWESGFYSFFVGQARFRYLIEFGFLLFCACFLAWLGDKVLAASRKFAQTS